MLRERHFRLGAEVHVVYRTKRSRASWQEQKKFTMQRRRYHLDLLTNPKEILVDENGWVKGMKVVKMELGEPDASGRRRPVEIPGSEYDIDLDTVIMSLGTSPKPTDCFYNKKVWRQTREDASFAEEDNGQTSKAFVFAGGDAVTGAATVILAMGAGKAGAKGIHEALSK